MHVVNHAWSSQDSPRFPKIPQDSPRFPFRTSTRSRLEALGPRAPLVFCFCFPPPPRPAQVAGPDTYREIKNAPPSVHRYAGPSEYNLKVAREIHTERNHASRFLMDWGVCQECAVCVRQSGMCGRPGARRQLLPKLLSRFIRVLSRCALGSWATPAYVGPVHSSTLRHRAYVTTLRRANADRRIRIPRLEDRVAPPGQCKAAPRLCGCLCSSRLPSSQHAPPEQRCSCASAAGQAHLASAACVQLHASARCSQPLLLCPSSATFTSSAKGHAPCSASGCQRSGSGANGPSQEGTELPAPFSGHAAHSRPDDRKG